MGSSKGNACAQHPHAEDDQPSASCDEFVTSTGADVETIARLNAGQRGRSWALPVDTGVAARIPAWTSRSIWHDQVKAALDSDTGQRLLATQKVKASRVIAVAVAMSLLASSDTGRDVTASNYRLARNAGVSERVVSRARRVLSDLGLAVEVERGRLLSAQERAAAKAHHGGYQARAASVWYLTTPRESAAVRAPFRRSASMGPGSRARRAASRIPQVSTGGDLPPSRGVCSSSLVRKNSPKRARAHTRRGMNSSRNAALDLLPRPLHAQLTAAELVGCCIGLDSGAWRRLGFDQWIRVPGNHIGAVVDAIVAAGIDTTIWTGQAIKKRLDQHNKDRGLAWPNQIHQPAAFLRTLLSNLDWSQQVPPEPAAVARARSAANRAEAQRQRAESAATDVAKGPGFARYRRWRTEMDRKKPHLAKKLPTPAPQSPEEPTDGGRPLLRWLVEEEAPTRLAGGI
ncbi:hypothetical protein [Nocardia sp. XZ_19_369]|uniref:hypothetical protein n=1 Tax=Nocardia sp. XZ_19_369 TaxID=2769487 RepID=UPI00188E6D05|nr:hypothetical protein [Nocardia sp. XZ_19_369]